MKTSLAMLALSLGSPAFGSADAAKASAVVAASGEAGTATVRLDDYLTLKQKGELESLTSIEEITLGGSFQKSLSLKVSGSSMGSSPAAAFLKTAPDLSLAGCAGNAVLKKDGDQYAIVPAPAFREAKRFSLTCQLKIKNWSELQLQFVNAIHVEAKVAGMEALILNENEAHRVVLQPMSRAATTERAEVSAVGRYLVSVRPEENRFTYAFAINNPNASRAAWELALANSEVVQKVQFTGEYDEKPAGHYTFKVNPGEATVTVRGVLRGNTLQPPLKGQQYLLIENHPLLQLKLSAKGRRIAPGDTGLQPAFPGARGYLLDGKEALSWETVKLQVFTALGFSVNAANYLFYIPDSGKAVIESRLNIQNQGSPEIPLRIPGKATYVEVNGQPQVLSKDPEGNLLLQLASGSNQVVFQYQPDREVGGGLARIADSLARPNAVMSNVRVSLSTPAKWKFAALRGLNDFTSDFEPGSALFFLVSLVLLGAAFHNVFHFAKSKAAGLLTVFAVLALIEPMALTLLWVLGAAGLAVRHTGDIRAYFGKFPKRTLLIGAATLVIFVIAVNSIVEQASRVASRSFSKLDSSLYDEGAPAAALRGAAAPREKGTANAEAFRVKTEESGSGEGEYQGLPAKISIPEGTHNVTFAQGMLDENSELRLRGLLLSRSLSAAFAVLLLALLVWRLYPSRSQLMHWLRRTGERLPVSTP